MKLRTIAEIQHKSPTTNMDRSNVTGVLATGSVNDLFHGKQKEKSKNRKKPSASEPKPADPV